VVDIAEEAVVAAAAAEADTPMGTIIMAVEITTPVDIPTGMTTLGLDIVVKSVAFRSFWVVLR
jgi:hypothetical protein